MNYLAKITIISTPLIISLVSNNVAANKNDYLELLNNEAEETRLDSGSNHGHNSQQTVEKYWPGECDYTTEQMPPGILWEEFSSYLKRCSIGSYVFYKKLKPGSQYSVYKYYKKTKNLKLQSLQSYVLNNF